MKNDNKFLLIYLLSTLIFFITHYLYLGWDFSAYVLNAKYWFAGGQYFEIYRAPLVSFLIGCFSIFSWKGAEYLFIAFSSGLFAYSSIKFAQGFKVDKFAYYLLGLNFFVLIFGVIEGTELISLALLQLFLVSIVKGESRSGFYLALACLCRYNLVIFFPLILIHKDIKKILKSVGLFVLAFIPWFIYNGIKYGDIFYSLADSIALNVIYRGYMSSSIVWSNFLYAWNFLIPLILIGFVYFIYKEKIDKKYILILAFFALSFYSVYDLKSNILRYFFLLVIPGVFFASYSLKLFSEKVRKIILVCFVILTVISLAYVFFSFSSPDYSEVLNQLEGYGDCKIKSNIWVVLNEKGIVSEAFPNQELVEYYIAEGHILVYKYDSREPEYIFDEEFISQFPLIYESEEYIIIGDGCIPIETVDESYMVRLNSFLYQVHNYTEAENSCELLFRNNSLCHGINEIFTSS